MKIIINAKVYLFVLFLSSLNIMAQQLGTVNGKVSLSGNKPAENIAVALKGTKYSDITTVSGHYEIKNVRGISAFKVKCL